MKNVWQDKGGAPRQAAWDLMFTPMEQPHCYWVVAIFGGSNGHVLRKNANIYELCLLRHVII